MAGLSLMSTQLGLSIYPLISPVGFSISISLTAVERSVPIANPFVDSVITLAGLLLSATHSRNTLTNSDL